MLNNPIQKIKITDIIIEDETYPRVQTNSYFIKSYFYAMKSGAKFPPIKLGEYNGALYLIDGLHRIKANQQLKNTEVEAEITSYKSKTAMLIAATEANNMHGKPLTFHDKTKIFMLLRQANVNDPAISGLLSVPLDKFSVLVDRIKNIEGIDVPFRRVVSERLTQHAIPEQYIPQLANPKTQNPVITNASVKMLESMIYYLQRNLIDFTDKKTNELGLELLNLLQQKLNPQSTIK